MFTLNSSFYGILLFQCHQFFSHPENRRPVLTCSVGTRPDTQAVADFVPLDLGSVVRRTMLCYLGR